jgi:hypothetical protein
VLQQGLRSAIALTDVWAVCLQSIQHRVKYPVNFEDWSKSQKADFRRARYAVADTLSVAAQLVGAETCLDLLVKPLATLSEQVAAGQAFEWRAAEAALYCIRSVCKVREEKSVCALWTQQS